MSLTYHALDEGLSLSAEGTATHLVLLGKKEDLVIAASKACMSSVVLDRKKNPLYLCNDC